MSKNAIENARKHSEMIIEDRDKKENILKVILFEYFGTY